MGLGMTLERTILYAEIKTLLGSTIQVSLAMRKDVGTNGLSDTAILSTMITLTRSINRQERYGEGDAILEATYARFKDLLATNNPISYSFYYEKARNLRFQGRLLESEVDLRALLKRPAALAPVYEHLNTMQHLAEVYIKLGRYAEATAAYKHRFRLWIETFGNMHHNTISHG
jgi:tetratricopeptide (TPR) repeat protein